MKVDIHINLGLFPDSEQARSTPLYTSIEDIVDFIQRNELTHACILYPRDEYNTLQEIAMLSPDTVIYGLQVLMGKDRENPTNIKEVKLDILDSSKVLCHGIKIASHRGWWTDGPQLAPTKPQSGLDYGQRSREIISLFKRLPQNTIVSMHLQGDPINNSGSIPMMVAKYAHKFPWLKFIMNHVGDYGPESQTAKNKKHIYLRKTGGDWNLYAPFRHAHSRALIQACVEYANNMHNIWLDSSCYMLHKANILKNTRKWCVGSDYPFNDSKTRFLQEERKFKLVMEDSTIERAYEHTEQWFKSTWQELYRDHVIALDLDDDVNVVIEKIENECLVRMPR